MQQLNMEGNQWSQWLIFSIFALDNKYYRKRCNPLYKTHDWSSITKSRECVPSVSVRWWLPHQYLRGTVSNLWVHWHSGHVAEWGLATVVSSDFRGLQVGMLVNNVSPVCFGGRVRRLEALISAWVHIVRLCIIYMPVRVWLCTHGILYYRPIFLLFYPMRPPLCSSTRLILPSRSFLREAAFGRKRHLLSERMP